MRASGVLKGHMIKGKEAQRLQDAYSGNSETRWLAWGPYLSERQWGTVREDYSAGGNAWSYLPHDHARSRAYRWGEDGLAGISDEKQRLCFALALWNERDPILKERLFGLTNDEGNHGEDVKEYYYYVDNTPSHSYMKWLYKYPQRAFPYAELVAENARRKSTDPRAFEYELVDTGAFADARYFDVQVEYAKAAPQDILIKISVTNCGPEAATIHLLPTLWFRNTWSWTHDAEKPALQGTRATAPGGVATLRATPAQTAHKAGPREAVVGIDPMMLYCLAPDDLLVVENESNSERLWGTANKTPYPKDGINDHVVMMKDSVNPTLSGTKGAAAYHLQVGAGASVEVRLRLSADLALVQPFGTDFDATFRARIAEADEFYESIGPAELSADQKAIQRQAYAGMLWSKQFYYYVVNDWLKGDPTQPEPPAGRSRNQSWKHFHASNILSMPDAWEYPWFASWDLCFQSVVFSRIDVQFAKDQLLILAREWYMSPAGAVPAYEWAFGDVNPPLHAWAALRIFEIEKEMHGGDGDIAFLQDIFRYCLMYFTWWTNRKDADDNDLFQGGFLGLDNISILDRSHLDAVEAEVGRKLQLYQSDGTSWMAMFSLNLMQMAIMLSRSGLTEYDSLASKFFQHFVFIASAMNSIEHSSQNQARLWHEDDGFFYDVLKVEGANGEADRYLNVELRSLVGIIALFPAMSFDYGMLDTGAAHEMRDRIMWFVGQHRELLDHAVLRHKDDVDKRLLSLVKPERLRRILSRLLDEAEFLGPHGIRGVSRAHLETPYVLNVNGTMLKVQYEPAESSVGLFGGNSNWRGPVWFPINFLLIEALRSFHDFLGDNFTVECPTRSGRQQTLCEVADELARRLVGTFERGADGRRPVHGGTRLFQEHPGWKDLVLFYEYFHGDNGAGLGASHQTGWTGLVAELMRRP